jgi:hypothetical protein
MLESKENSVKIEGILSEIDLEAGSYVKDGKTIEKIGGSIKVRVTQMLNGENVELDIPVYMFANKLTNKGTSNPAYASIERVMNEYKSIAAVGVDAADRVRITGANIRMNEYYGQGDKLNSYPRVNASFVTKVTDMSKYNPEATFSAIFAIGSMGYETDKDGVEVADRYKIRGIMPQYGGSVDVIDFFATSPNVIDAVSSYWEQGDTVKINGKLNFTSKTEEKLVEVDFGEPRVERKTISVSELIITGGSQTPLEGDFAFDMDEIQAALEARQARLAELKAKTKAKAKDSKSAPKVAATGKKSALDLGF